MYNTDKSFKENLTEARLLDPPSKFKGYLGAAAISLERTVASPEYVLNGKGQDGWFRRMEGAGKGYGLMIRDIKVTSKTDELANDKSYYSRYKVTVSYLPNSADSEDAKLEKANGWLWINNEFTLEEVIKYIKSNMSSWKP